jgi:hypothetical protein
MYLLYRVYAIIQYKGKVHGNKEIIETSIQKDDSDGPSLGKDSYI